MSKKVSSLYFFLKYLSKYKKGIAGIILALTAASFSVLSVGVGLKYLIDYGFSEQNEAMLNLALGFLILVAAIMATASFTRYFLVTKIGDLLVADIRKDIFYHLLKLSPAFYENEKSAGLISRITTDTTLLQLAITSSLAIAARNILVLSGGIAMLIFTSPKLTAYIAIIVPLVVIPIVVFGKKVRKLSAITQEKVADLSANAEEAVAGIKTVQAFSNENFERQKFSEFIDKILSASHTRIKMRSILNAMVIMFAFSSVAFVLWIGGHGVLKGEVSAGALSAFIFYSIVVSGSVGAITDVIGDLQRAAGVADGLKKILETEAEIKSPENPQAINENAKGELEFSNVTFYYPSRPEKASLDNLSFKVRDGEKVALVGLSGAGKSTIFQMALRFYDPITGRVLFNKTDIRNFSLEEYRENFAIVSQEPMIFSGTIKENIAYGKLAASNEEIISAAKAANADNFIMKLKDGYETYVGERGLRLSGGERQRIAIARAFIRRPKILLLDEATNALDAENENLVQGALENLMKKCTTIIIAHRLSTVLKCDRILVIADGKIEEEGSHNELLMKKGTYWRFAELQFNLNSGVYDSDNVKPNFIN